MTFFLEAATVMNPQVSHDPSYEAGLRGERVPGAKSGFQVMSLAPRPGRSNSFIYGLSDSRIRPLLNQEERDRLHCWSLVVALVSSVAGTTLLLTAILQAY